MIDVSRRGVLASGRVLEVPNASIERRADKPKLWVWALAFIALTLGSLVGGFYSAKLSQRIDSEKLRYAIATYGFAMTIYFFWRAFA